MQQAAIVTRIRWLRWTQSALSTDFAGDRSLRQKPSNKQICKRKIAVSTVENAHIRTSIR
jgi:hypothetical protein